MKQIKYRQHNGYDTREASDQAVAWTDPGISMTVQSQAEDADINVLMRRYGILGQMPENPRVPMYGDFTDIKDYATALEAIQRANEGFAEFPAEVRARFENNPQLLLEFVENEANRAEAISLGLVKAPQAAIVPPPPHPRYPPPLPNRPRGS